MQRYEYHVVPAPRRGEKARGVKTTEERFALALTGLMNELGLSGWEYVRADVLPCDERAGLTGSKTTYQNMLVFKRVLVVALEEVPHVRVVSLAPLTLAVPFVGAADAPMGAAPSIQSDAADKSGHAAE